MVLIVAALRLILPVPATNVTADAKVLLPMLTVFWLAFVPMLMLPVVPESRFRVPVVPVYIVKFLAAAVVISVPIVPLKIMPLVAVPAVLVRFIKLVVVPAALLLIRRPLLIVPVV